MNGDLVAGDPQGALGDDDVAPVDRDALGVVRLGAVGLDLDGLLAVGGQGEGAAGQTASSTRPVASVSARSVRRRFMACSHVAQQFQAAFRQVRLHAHTVRLGAWAW